MVGSNAGGERTSNFPKVGLPFRSWQGFSEFTILLILSDSVRFCPILSETLWSTRHHDACIVCLRGPNRTLSDKIGQYRTISDKIGQNRHRTKSDKIGRMFDGPRRTNMPTSGKGTPVDPNDPTIVKSSKLDSMRQCLPNNPFLE